MFLVLAEDADNEYAMIDSTIVPTHQQSAGAKGGDKNEEAISSRSPLRRGPSKGGLSTKIHADALGNPTGFYLTAGQKCDLDGSDVL